MCVRTAAAYIRVSTEEQIEFSPESQIKEIRGYAQRNNIMLPDKYVFLDEHVIIGTSGENLVKSRGSALVPFSFLLRDKPKSFKSLKIINERL